SEESCKRTARRFSATRLPNLILPLDQDRQQLLFDVAAAVPALIDDHRFLVAILAQLLLESSQRRWIHRLDVQVADTSTRQLINFLATLAHPTLVAQLAVSIRRDRFDTRVPRPGVSRCRVERHVDLAIETRVQERPVFIARFDLLAVDR